MPTAPPWRLAARRQLRRQPTYPGALVRQGRNHPSAWGADDACALAAELRPLLHRLAPQIRRESEDRHDVAITFGAGAVIVALALVAILFLAELPLRAHHAR